MFEFDQKEWLLPIVAIFCASCLWSIERLLRAILRILEKRG